MGQLQDSLYRDFPHVIRQVTQAQFLAQTNGPPEHPGITYRVDGKSLMGYVDGQWTRLNPSDQSKIRQADLMPIRSFGSTGAASMSRHMARYIPGLQFSAVRVTVFNSHTGVVAHKASCLTSNAIGDGLYNAGDWKKMTFGGLADSAPPGQNADDYGTHTSDLLYLDSQVYQDGTIFAMRSAGPVLGNSSRGIIQGATSNDLAANGFCCYRQTGVDIVTNKGDLTAPVVDGFSPPLAWTFYGTKQARRIGLFGASTFAGKDDTVQLGWPVRAANAMTTATEYVQFVNFSVSGRRTSDSLASFKYHLARGILLDDAVLPVTTTNDESDPDWGTPAYVVRVIAQCMEFIRLCRIYGIRPWLATSQIRGLLADVAPKAEYTIMKMANQAGRDIARDEIQLKTGNSGMADFEGWFSDTTQAVGTWITPANTTDNLHVNAVGQANVLVPKIQIAMAIR